MHPKNLTPGLLEVYGRPLIKRVFGLTSAYYHPGRTQGWAIARQMAQANLLSDKGRTAFLATQPRNEKDWAKVAEVEDIPAQGFTAPFAIEQLANIQQRAKLSEVTFDQDTFNTLYACLMLYSTNAAAIKAATYPLLDGPPGASKSLLANICAALLGLPVVTVTGSDGSADEIKIELFGGDNANSKDLTGIVKDYIYHGWLQHPLSLRLAAQEQRVHGSLDSFRTDTLLEIAQHERLKDNITAFMPGKYQLAARHGYLLFLDETNGFKGVTTLLTQLLENYTTQLHPNFFVIGAMNPAGEKHNREPLPPEIRSRFNTIPVLPPSADSYYQMLNFFFTGEQPVIGMPNGTTKRVDGSMLGLTIPARQPSLFKKSVIPAHFKTFLENFAKFHKAVEIKLEDGVIDPKNSTLGIQETLSIDRRTISKCMVGMETMLALKLEGSDSMSGGTLTMEEYECLNSKDLTQAILLSAIHEALELFYVRPFHFPISEDIETDKGKKREFKTAAAIVRFLMEAHGLTPSKLKDSLKTTVEETKTRNEWISLYKASPLYEESQIPNVLQDAAAQELKPESKHIVFIRSTQSHKVSVCSLQYLSTIASRKGFSKENYPQLDIKSPTGSKVCPIVDRRLGELAKNNRRFISKAEFQHTKEVLFEIHKRFPKACFIMPLFDPDTDNVQLAVGLPINCLQPDKYAEKKAKGLSHQTLIASLRKGSEQPIDKELSECVISMFQPEDDKPIDLTSVEEEIVLEFTVQIP